MAQRPSFAAVAHHESFRHETLRLSENSVRLFQVQAGPLDSPISLRITQYSMQKRPAYKAISYTWGSSRDSRPILVNGRTFSLHPNLWHLLNHLRQRKETSFLWADRLCIDQENFAERNFHVQLMGKIYEQASTVIVWLGLPSADRTEIRAMDFIKDIDAYRQTQHDSTIAEVYMKTDPYDRWGTLMRMCKHPYWTRTWIIQEFLRASSIELVCGKSSLDWQLFDSLLTLLQQPIYRNNAKVAPLFQTRPVRLSLRRHAADALNLHQLLLEYHDSMCTERRDKVYGIMGLATDCAGGPNGEARGIKPDYKRHVVHVYLDALRCIESTLQPKSLVASAANLVREVLMLTPEDFANYIRSNDIGFGLAAPFNLTADYVGIVRTSIPAWVSINDLKQKLETLDWGDYVGFEMRSQRPPNTRRSSTRIMHASLPQDLVQNVVNAAELEPELVNLHNYPQLDGLRVPVEHIVMTSAEKQYFENESRQRPSVILEQPTDGSSLRLGFACTNARRGDLVLQFSGLDYTLIARRLGADIVLIGKAVLIKHSDVQVQPLDPVCADSPWYSTCPSGMTSESLHIETDALSLAELLTRT